MKPSMMKYLLIFAMLVPLLGGCSGDDDDDDMDMSPPPANDGGDDGGEDEDPNLSSISTIFNASADAEPIEIVDPEALAADIEANFGVPSDEPPEPGEVLDLGNEA